MVVLQAGMSRLGTSNMQLEDFHQHIQNRIAEEVERQAHDVDASLTSKELVFAEIVMQSLKDSDIVEHYDICHWTGTIGNARLRVSGSALSEDKSRLDLLITNYADTNNIQSITDTELMKACRCALQFIKHAAGGKLLSRLEPSHDVYALVDKIQKQWSSLDQVRVLLLTDSQSRSKHFKGEEISGKGVNVEVIDIERLHRHWSGKANEEIVISFEHAIGYPLPCVYVPDPNADYEYALAAVPGEVISALYERHNTRLLESNVRTFLGRRGKVNKGIASTLKIEPSHFMAFNNGLVVICDSAEFSTSNDGAASISKLNGVQIVNGGQTTSSIYFAKRENRDLDLSHVRVAVKIIIPKCDKNTGLGRLVTDISKYANSQNTVRVSDLSTNRPFHVQLEKLSETHWQPDGVGRWFYERAAGSYNLLLMREGTTAAKRRQIRNQIPPSRKLTKVAVAGIHEAWRQLPAQAALGDEKNLAIFMNALDETPDLAPDPLDKVWFHQMIGKVIIFQSILSRIKTKEAKSTFHQGYKSVAFYVLAVVSHQLGEQIDFNTIWRNQSISSELSDLLYSWAVIVNKAFEEAGKGATFAEVAKRKELWENIRNDYYPSPEGSIPEIESFTAREDLRKTG